MNYGQALLIKHLLVVPLVFLAFFNGFYSRWQFKREKDFHPLKWARLESIVLLVIFFVTAYMGQQSPPHDLSQVLHFYGATPIFIKLYGHPITNAFTVQLHFGKISFVFGLMSLLFLLFISLGVIRKIPSIMMGVFILGYLLSAYVGIMLAVK